MIRVLIQSVIEGVIKRFTGSGRQDETLTDREYFQHYGFTSRPKDGAEGFAFIRGNQIIMIASEDRRYRISLEEGEVALFTDEGDKVHLKRGEILIHSEGKITAEAPEIDANASIKISATAPEIDATATVKVTITSPEVDVIAVTTVNVVSPMILLGAASGHMALRKVDNSATVNVMAT